MYENQSRTFTGNSSSGSLVGAAQLGTPQTIPGVHSALSGVDTATGELAQQFGALVSRLEAAGVLRAVPPQGNAGNQPTPPSYNCSLANAIDQQRLRVHQVIVAITEINERIDL